MNQGAIRVFQDAVAIVTGGASGIGRAMAEELARRGARVILADRQIELAREVAGGITGSGGRAEARELDVRDHDAFEALIRETADQNGRLDFLFNNAGIAIAGQAWQHELDDWKQIVDVNLWGVIHGTTAAFRVMRDQGFGHIVNTSSLAGLAPFPFEAAYCATKHAVVGLTLALRIEAASDGVRASAICPGLIRTPILQNGGAYGKVLTEIPQDITDARIEKMRPMPPDRFARQAINGVARNRPIIIAPTSWKLYWLLNRISPRFWIFIARKMFEKYIVEYRTYLK